jgi:ATP-dependent helicase/nuclease subunit B
MRSRAWPALSYTNEAALDPSVSALLFVSPLKASISQLETAAACPFRHFARYGLKLYGRDDAEVTPIDLSNAYHAVLQDLVEDSLASGQDWCGIPPEQTRELIRTHAAEIGRRLRGELMLSSSRNRYMLDRIERTLQQAVTSMMEMHQRGKYRPKFAGLRFCEGGTLPAHRIGSPNGNEVHLHGTIDRVDLHQQRSGFVVSDYKFTAGALRLDRVYHGLSLQLLTYLLVVQAGGQQLAGRKLIPAAAFLLQLLRSPQAVDHPSDAKDPTDPDFPLRIKPRGLIDARAINSLDSKLEEGASPVVQVYIKKGGETGRRNATDDATEEEFTALLKHVEKRLGEITDEILRGNVAVHPYMIGNRTPCPHCEYRSVCRFEPGINHYRMLPTMKREDVLAIVSGQSINTETPRHGEEKQ